MKNIDILDILIQSEINNSKIYVNQNIISLYIHINGDIILLKLLPLLTCNYKEYFINQWNLNTDNTILYNVISNSCHIYGNKSSTEIKNHIQRLIQFYENKNTVSFSNYYN